MITIVFDLRIDFSLLQLPLAPPGLIISSPSLNATERDDFLFRFRDATLAKFVPPSSTPRDDILLLWAVLNSVKSYLIKRE